MKQLKKQALFASQLLFFSVIIFSTVSCGGSFAYLHKAENPYNYPQYDYFVAKGQNSISDFDLRGNVKKVVQYKAIQNPATTNKSKDFELSFTPEGNLLSISRYHTGSFFFHGRKDIEITVVYRGREKILIENHIMADSSTVRLKNTYDRLGNLITTEDELSLRKYYYDSEERVIKEEQYQKINSRVQNSPVSTHFIEFKNDTYKVKTRQNEEIPQENLLFRNTFHEFYYYDDAGILEKRQTATASDTITFLYNKNRQLLSESHNRGGRPFRATTYGYDDQNRLVEENLFRQGTLYQTHNYQYDETGNLIKKTSYLNSRKLSETIHIYTYDTNNNWITKSTVVKDFFDDKEYEFGILSRDIEYFE